MKASGWSSSTVSPRSTVIRRTMPETWAAMTCSIFIASMTRTCSPWRTAAPSATVTLTMVPCMGAGSGTVFSGPVTSDGDAVS